MFTGEFVPETLSVTIEDSEHAPLDTIYLVDEITRYIKKNYKPSLTQ